MVNSTNTYQAWIIREHGGDEKLSFQKMVKNPAPDDQVWVQVHRVSLNHLDLWVRKGVPGHHFPLPIVPGCDIVGDHDGQLVLLQAAYGCGVCNFCKSDEATLCRNFSVLGESRDGGCAEWIAVPKRLLIPLKPTDNLQAMVTLPVAGVTAWRMLKKAAPKAGSWVFIRSASSGVSSFAIPLAKRFGAHVVTTVRDPSRVEYAKKLGADLVIDLSRGSLREQIKPILKSEGLRGFQVAIDHNGGQDFQETLSLLDWGGRIVLCGATAESAVQFDLKPIFFKSQSILGSTLGSRKDLEELVAMVRQGELHPIIDREFSLNELPEAHRYLENRKTMGKVLICVSG